MKTFDHIKVYEANRDILGKTQKVSVVEISPDFERISHFLGVYDEILKLNNPILITGKEINLSIIEALLQICCEHFTIVEVQGDRFRDSLDLVIDLFIVNVDLENVDEAVLAKYIKIYNGKNLFFNFKGADSAKVEELSRKLGMGQKKIPFNIES